MPAVCVLFWALMSGSGYGAALDGLPGNDTRHPYGLVTEAHRHLPFPDSAGAASLSGWRCRIGCSSARLYPTETWGRRDPLPFGRGSRIGRNGAPAAAAAALPPRLAAQV